LGILSPLSTGDTIKCTGKLGGKTVLTELLFQREIKIVKE
jgi:hypothetical protein